MGVLDNRCAQRVANGASLGAALGASIGAAQLPLSSLLVLQICTAELQRCRGALRSYGKDLSRSD